MKGNLKRCRKLVVQMSYTIFHGDTRHK